MLVLVESVLIAFHKKHYWLPQKMCIIHVFPLFSMCLLVEIDLGNKWREIEVWFMLDKWGMLDI